MSTLKFPPISVSEVSAIILALDYYLNSSDVKESERVFYTDLVQKIRFWKRDCF